MTATKASTCCARDGAECACGKSQMITSKKFINNSHQRSDPTTNYRRTQLKRQPAPAESNPPSTATAPRLLQRTPSRDQDARAGRGPPASVPATALPKRTPPSPDLPAPAAQDPPVRVLPLQKSTRSVGLRALLICFSQMLALAKRPVMGASTPLQRLTLPPASNCSSFFLFFWHSSLTILRICRGKNLAVGRTRRFRERGWN